MAITKLIEAFEAMRKEFSAQSKMGACDSEPIWVLRRIIKAIYKGKEVKIPRTAEGWDLYSSLPGSGEAAAKLHAAVSKVKEEHDKLTMGDARSQVYKDLMEYYE